MPITQKRIQGDYAITTLNAQDNVIINTNTLEINGNLEVNGNLTYINVEELNVKDPFIVVNSSNTGTFASNSGLLTHDTDSVFAGIRYNGVAGQWELNNGDTDSTGLTGNWTSIDTGNVTVNPGGANTQIQFNNSSSFGGSVNFTFDQAIGKVTLQGHQAFGNIGGPPSVTSGAATLYHNEQGQGGTGLYVRSPTVEAELISKPKAIAFGLIL